MTAVKPIRVAVAGAAGNIGYSLVFRIAAGGLFGPDQPVALQLLELHHALPQLEACAMELHDSAYPLLAGMTIGTDSREIFRDADWIILLGGKPLSRETPDRIDLLRTNALTMVEQGRAINQAAPTARVLVVAQPCNTNCLIALSQAKDVPKEHWFAMNRLPWLRAVSMVAEKTNASVSQISRVTVWGNTSRTAYIDVRHALVGDKPVLEAIGDSEWITKVMEPTVVGRDREILEVRGTTPAGSVAQAILGTIRSITIPTLYERWFPACVVSDGSYGIPRGLVFGLPVVTRDGQTWSIVDDLYLDETASERIAANVAELEHESLAISHLL
jgi:malate dehydrogenase